VGLNTNLTVGEQVVHVQTEDLGRQRASIVTHAFSKGGQVVRKVRYDYSKHLGHPNLAHILPRAMQAQHVAVMQRLRAEGAAPTLDLTGSDLPCVREEKTPSPDLVAPPAQRTHLRLNTGVWDNLVAQAREAKQRERADKPAIPLPDAGSAPATPEPEQTAPPSKERGSSWEAAVASARRDYEKTPPPELISEDELAARRAFDESIACLQEDRHEAALVLLCKAVSLAPKNPLFRSRLLRVLSLMGNSITLHKLARER
jgi:hypothetical protein